ncbi:MAG: Bax inhibitor-1/YccA family protein [Candidatus Adiutrix sp.]|jgi:FtsH-binding integral membrane protein|nr:Bax inhibitor-1/YccA family protein [Candidatus Adiutrix sp.]
MQDFTKYNPNSEGVGVRQDVLSSEALYFQRIYLWMCAGLSLTAGTAFVLSTSQGWLGFLFQNRWALWVAFGAQLGLVFYLSARINSLSPGAAKGLFLAYAALTGATFSVLLLVYPTYAFVKAFICTAGIYGAMALYGLVTKRSLQALGSFLFAGLVGLILASLVNIFWAGSSQMDLVICVLGVLIFAGLTAYDHQKLRVMRYSLESQGLGFEAVDQESRLVVMGALTLYLDFINIFLFLLRLFGRRD